MRRALPAILLLFAVSVAGAQAQQDAEVKVLALGLDAMKMGRWDAGIEILGRPLSSANAPMRNYLLAVCYSNLSDAEKTLHHATSALESTVLPSRYRQAAVRLARWAIAELAVEKPKLELGLEHRRGPSALERESIERKRANLLAAYREKLKPYVDVDRVILSARMSQSSIRSGPEAAAEAIRKLLDGTAEDPNPLPEVPFEHLSSDLPPVESSE